MKDNTKAPKYDSFKPSSPLSSLIKSRTKSKNTRAELALRHHLWRLGLRYKLHVANLPGKPDIVFTSAKVVLFCDGDFWHGRKWKTLKKQLTSRANAKYWIPKIEANINRDNLHTKKLKEMGWHVVRIWETDILKDSASVVKKIYEIVKRC